jgi:hypothetical protein
MAKKPPSDFQELANQRFEEARKFWRNWRTEARDDFAFVSGSQWLEEDITILTAQKRPPITFNYSEKMIDAVVGAEVSNRQEITYAPRELNDAPLAELWTNAAQWARDEGDHEDEESDAFRDCLICGIGWTFTKMSYDEDIEGMIDTGKVDPLEMYPDPSAVKSCFRDRRYQFREWWVDEKLAKRRWPKALIFPDNDLNTGTDVIRSGHRYEDADNDENEPGLHAGQVQIRHYECVELEPFYRVATANSMMEVSQADFSGLKDALDEAGVQYVKQFKRVYYHGFFAGETLLESSESPCQVGFCYQAITGKRDRNRSYYYGLTRVMKDPQRWANKWLSQILHIINSNAKGGLLAEVNAFVDPQRAQDTYASPDSIVFLKEGALSGQKVKEKAMTNYPQGLDRLMEFALASLPQVTGINLEALGLAGREQANVLEQSRKQAAYGLLAPIFDSLRRYRKNQGRVLLYFIHTYISDGRLIRIGGADSKVFVPLTKADKAPIYDIIVDQSPHAPDVKTKTWETLQNIIPQAMKAGIPLPPDILDYVPIPTALTTKWKQFIAQNPPVNQEKVQEMQQQIQQLTQQNQDMQAKLRDKSANLQMDGIETKAKLEMELAKLQETIRLKRQELAANLQIAQEKAANDIAIAHEKNQAAIESQRLQVEQSGQNDAQKNVMGSINELIGIIGKLQAEDSADSGD